MMAIKDVDATESVDFNESALIRRTYIIDNHWINSSSLYLQEESADVFFEIVDGGGNSHRIPAHKRLLTAGSEVFQRLFFGISQASEDIKIESDDDFVVTAEGFREFLRIFYSNEIQITSQNFVQIYELARKYLVRKWTSRCLDFMEDTVIISTIIGIINLSYQYNLQGIWQRSYPILKQNANQILASDYFIECSRNEFLTIRIYEGIPAQSCFNWLKKCCRQRNIDSKMLRKEMCKQVDWVKIKFADDDDIFTCLQKYFDFFTNDEIKQIVDHREVIVHKGN